MQLTNGKSVWFSSKAAIPVERLALVDGEPIYNAGWREQDITPASFGLVPISWFYSYAPSCIHLFTRYGCLLCSGVHAGSVHLLWHGSVSSVQGPWVPGGHCSLLCAQVIESRHSRHRWWGALLEQLSIDPHLSPASHTLNHTMHSRCKHTLSMADSADSAKISK